MSLTQERKAEIVAQFGENAQDTGQHPRPDRAAHASGSTTSRAPARAQQGPPLAPRPAHARRPAPAAAQLHAAQRPRGLPLAHPRARPSPVSAPPPRGHHRAGHAGAGVLAGPRGQGDVHARGPARQDDRARLLSVRLQPGLHRPAPGLRRGPRASSPPSGADALRRLLRPLVLADARSASGSASRSSSSRTSSRRARRRGRSARGSRRAGCSARALVIVGPDGVVQWSHRAESLGDLPGANLIFDALAAPAS